MHADELRTAVRRVVEVLNKADILAVVKEYRTARGDSRAVAAARLGHSGAVIMENMDKFSKAEKAVVEAMFLESLGTTQYWQGLLASAGDPSKNAAELVHLFSRVMFASTHLPNLANLLGQADGVGMAVNTALTGEARLTIRLSDAGERAADPDRIARSIDGIDMLYSACASIARKPAMDLRLDGISGSDVRDIHFMGERDSITAVGAVIGSIPEVLDEIDPNEDIDLDDVVASLPIFEDLNTLANLGTFTPTDLKDISETMHQGAMLILESGVTLVDEAADAAAKNAQNDAAQSHAATNNANAAQSANGSSAPPILTRRPAGANGNGAENGGDAEGETDEHYERYLREREALQNKDWNDAAQQASRQAQQANGRANGQVPPTRQQDTVNENDILKNLGRSRDR